MFKMSAVTKKILKWSKWLHDLLNRMKFELLLYDNELYEIQSNLYIKGTGRTCKCVLYEQVPFIYRFKLYALFIK